MNKKFIFSLILFLPVIVLSQKITLEDAINIALKKNLDIEIAKNNLEISSINNHIGIAGGLPTIIATISDQENVSNINQKLNTGTEISKNGAFNNSFNANLSASILVFNNYRVVATKKRLEQLKMQGEQQLASQIQNIISNVTLQYFNIIKEQSYLSTLQQSINISKKQLEIINTKKDIGMANDADVFQSKIDLNTRMQDFYTQELAIKRAVADFSNLLYLKADSNIWVKDSIVIGETLSYDKILSTIQANADVSALDYQIKVNKLLEKETKDQRFPSLRANAGINYGRTQSDAGQLLLNQSYGPFVGLTLGIPLYSSGNIKRQEKIAGINTKIAISQKDKLINYYQAEVFKTYQTYITAKAQINSQQDNFELAKKLVDLVMQKFQLSQATILELNAAQKSYEDAAFKLVSIKYIAKVAEIELRRISNNF